jgi:hypothetical protein
VATRVCFLQILVGQLKILLLDGNAAFADVELDAGGLLPLLVELIAQDHDGNGELADNKLENSAIHLPAALSSCPRWQDLALRAELSSTPMGGAPPAICRNAGDESRVSPTCQCPTSLGRTSPYSP